MMLLAYQALGALLLAAAALLLPFRPRWRRGLGERLGFERPGDRAGAGGDLIWVHAASVGEVRAAAPLAEALLRALPACRILVTTVTESGRDVAARVLAPAGPRVRCRLAPLDWGGIPARLIRREQPRLAILLETELWPVLLSALRSARVPLLLANGRISPRSFGRYRVLRRALAPLFRAVTVALVRTAADAQRFEALGVPAERIRVAGNLKHTPVARPGDGERRAAARARLGASSGRTVLVAGSLRGAEALLVLAAFRRLRAEVPGLLLLLAPRHPERFDEGALADWTGSWVRWSSAPVQVEPTVAVVLLDTVGDLADCYAAAAVACVGGSWAARGGHNLLEPAFFGVPVVFGPDFRHFDEEGRALIGAGGGFLAAGAEELHAQCRRLLLDPAARAEAGRRAAEVAAGFGGAVEKTLAAVREILG